MRINFAHEGEILKQGINLGESSLTYFVSIRRGNNILHIHIPKRHPEDYDIYEVVKEIWDQKLWS